MKAGPRAYAPTSVRDIYETVAAAVCLSVYPTSDLENYAT